jgi:hypothetical protein
MTPLTTYQLCKAVLRSRIRFRIYIRFRIQIQFNFQFCIRILMRNQKLNRIRSGTRWGTGSGSGTLLCAIDKWSAVSLTPLTSGGWFRWHRWPQQNWFHSWISLRIRTHMQNGFNPWVKGPNGVVWSRDRVPLNREQPCLNGPWHEIFDLQFFFIKQIHLGPWPTVC